MTLKGLNEAVEKAKAIYPFEDDKTRVGIGVTKDKCEFLRFYSKDKADVEVQITVMVFDKDADYYA